MDYGKLADYWERVARRGGADPDQIAARNVLIPPEVHRSVRLRQVGFLRGVLQRLPASRHVLDLGCGPGTWALELASEVDSWLGYDISSSFVEEARRSAARAGHSHLSFQTGSLLDVDAGSYDLVVLSGALGYVQDADLLPVLLRARQHLKPGGMVYVRVSSMAWPYPRLARRGAYQIVYRRHQEYLDAFRKAGFRCEASRDLAHTESILAAVYCVAGGLLGLPAGSVCRLAGRASWLTYGVARQLMDLLPVPQPHHFVLIPA
ncbi:MAG: class I SAM-dependent methyltransferase [Candidatus Eremiobacterota bacterium]